AAEELSDCVTGGDRLVDDHRLRRDAGGDGVDERERGRGNRRRQVDRALAELGAHPVVRDTRGVPTARGVPVAAGGGAATNSFASASPWATASPAMMSGRSALASSRAARSTASRSPTIRGAIRVEPPRSRSRSALSTSTGRERNTGPVGCARAVLVARRTRRG